MVKNYKCPGCGASMVFDEGTNSMVCPQCGKTIPVAELAQEEKTEQPHASSVEQEKTVEETVDTSGNGMKEYQCPNCGASIVTDANTSATFCTFCNSPTLIEGRLSGSFEPKRIIPFQFDKKAAQEKFKTWTGKGWLTPSGFKSEAVMEKVTGMYVPYWLYDYDGAVDMDATATRTRRERRGNTEYIHTDHFRVSRNTRGSYAGVPADASEKMPDDRMAQLEPFDYQAMVEYQMPYLSGFLAEKYNYDAKELGEGVRQGIHNDIVNATRETIVGYEVVNVLRADVSLTNEHTEYDLLPVWTLNYSYGQKLYQLYMNGQTGQISGTLPTSKGKVALTFAIAFVVFFLLTMLIGGLLG